MPSSLGPAEILVILVVALIVLGPKRLPEAGRQIGKALGEMRRWSQTVQSEIRDVMDVDATSTPTSTTTATATTTTATAAAPSPSTAATEYPFPQPAPAGDTPQTPVGTEAAAPADRGAANGQAPDPRPDAPAGGTAAGGPPAG